MNNRLLTILAFLLIGISLAFAQTTKVTGTVTSAEDGSPIIGASIKVQSTNLGTITDANGKFTLNKLPSNAKKLEISYIGYKSLVLDIKPEMNITLSPDTEVLGEVVVTGMQRRTSACLREPRPNWMPTR